MAFNSTEKINQSVKLAQQILDGANDSPGAKWWYNAQRAWEPYARPNWVEKDNIPGADNPTEADAAVVANPTILEKLTIRLTLDITSNNRQYECRDTYGDITSSTIEDWIQPSLIRKYGAASNGYIVRLYHGDPESGGVEISTTYNSGTGGEPCWWFAYAPGILLISTDQASTFKSFYDTNGLYVVGYRYIGLTVADGVYGNEAKVSSDDTTSGFLEEKVIAGSGITIEVLNAGGDEKLVISTTPEVLNSLRVTEAISMEVDYVNGVSPAAGTIITSQADYDALGAPLKYPQDVFDILASFIDYPVIVDCVAGDHYAKSGTLVYPCFMYRPPYRSSAQNVRMDVTQPSEFRAPKIYFRGTTAVYEAAISGVTSYRNPAESSYARDAIFTRDSGTWTVGELRGKFVTIVSGAFAGNNFPVVDNTETTIHLAGYVGSIGACNIDIFECATRFIPKLGPTGASVSLGLMGWWSSTEDAQHGKFKWIQFGTEADKFNFSLTSKATDFLECVIHHSTAYMLEPLLGTRGYVKFERSQVVLNSQGLQARASRLDVFSSVISGNPASAYIVQLREHTVLYGVYAYIIALSSYAGSCLVLLTDSFPTLQGRFEIIGNSECTGIHFSGAGTSVTVEDSGYASVSRCNIALKFGRTFANLAQFATSIEANNIGWQLLNGAVVKSGNPSTILTAVSDIDLNGNIVDYSLLSSSGDEVSADGVSITRS